MTNPNLLDDRAAMGLPNRFVDGTVSNPVATNTDLLSTKPSTLTTIAETPEVPLPRRIAAATILGLRGDPRIGTFDPIMVDVPAAQVRIGLPSTEVDDVVARWQRYGVQPEWIAKECPEHWVSVDAFRMARFPVTNQEYREFLLAQAGCEAWLPTSWRFGVYPAAQANHPVWTVPPEAADAYAAWLATRTARRFRLPTEAEWEYAASGGDGREFPWGNNFDPSRLNTVEGGVLNTTPVGVYPTGRSPFGADDLGGNVEEYVADHYRPYPGGTTVIDDLQAATPQHRIARGGSFTRYGDLARTRRRHGWYQKPIYAMGFRLAETLTEAPKPEEADPHQ